MPVVTDAGPLIHLSQAGVLSLLEVPGEVVVPRTVLEEVQRGPTSLSELSFTVVEVDPDLDSTHSHLDPGETAALIVCADRDGVLLTDDMEARTTAAEMGVEVHGSIGVVLYAYSDEVLSATEARQVLRDLQQDTTLYLSAPLVEHAIRLVEDDDADW